MRDQIRTIAYNSIALASKRFLLVENLSRWIGWCCLICGMLVVLFSALSIHFYLLTPYVQGCFVIERWMECRIQRGVSLHERSIRFVTQFDALFWDCIFKHCSKQTADHFEKWNLRDSMWPFYHLVEEISRHLRILSGMAFFCGDRRRFFFLNLSNENSEEINWIKEQKRGRNSRDVEKGCGKRDRTDRTLNDRAHGAVQRLRKRQRCSMFGRRCMSKIAAPTTTQNDTEGPICQTRRLRAIDHGWHKHSGTTSNWNNS